MYTFLVSTNLGVELLGMGSLGYSSLTNFMNQGKLFSFSKTYFSYLCIGNKNTFPSGLWLGLNICKATGPKVAPPPFFPGYAGTLLPHTGFSSYGVWTWLPHCMWDLSSLTRDRTHIPYSGRWILNHWTTREISSSPFFFPSSVMPEPPLPEHMAFHARLLLCQESSPGTLEVHLLPRAPGAAIAPSPFSSVTQLLAPSPALACCAHCHCWHVF